MSNKITRVDRRMISKASNDATGGLESLSGKISVKDLGTRVTRTSLKSDGIDKKNLKTEVSERHGLTSGEPEASRPKKSSRKKGSSSVLKSSSFLDDAGLVEGLNYYPQTVETREAFDLIMAWVQAYLEDVPHETIRSAADAILSIIKDENLIDKEQKSQVDEILGLVVPNDKYNQLINLTRRITDYSNSIEEHARQRDTKLEEDSGVAVTFDSEEEDEDLYGDSEDDSESDDETNQQTAGTEDSDSEQIDDGEAEIIKPTESSSKSNKSASQMKASDQLKSKDTSDSIPAHEIDAYWLQRQVAEVYSDAQEVQEKSTQIFEILASDSPLSKVENEIMEIFDFDHFELTKKLCKNREKVVWLTRLARSTDNEERNNIITAMKSNGLQSLVEELQGVSQEDKESSAVKNQEDQDVEMIDDDRDGNVQSSLRPPKVIDIEALVFDQGHRLNTAGELRLPEGTTKSITRTYEEYDIPPPVKATNTGPLVDITTLPPWARPAFEGTKSLNPVQSKVFSSAFNTDENLLLCAPTGAGKTNVALLTILETISHYLDLDTNKIDLDAFKIVYISPLKALVQEQVREFSKKLKSYGINVAELTGDRNLTKQQIAETQMIVTTPEKWDVITRKSSDTSYTNLVRLIIIDEIHLLHDERGPVLENIVARTIRREIATGESVRLVGLSATLPNYKDVARFLRVDFDKGLYFFDSSYRPTPLAQAYIGITEKKAFKRYQAMNDACYDKVLQYAGQHQVIIFVHSRKETAKTARYLRDKAAEEGTLHKFLKSDSAATKLLTAESESVSNSDLKDLLPTGFAIHHAGLSRADRTSSEDMFREGYAQVLVSTATLAWGVNLPAHTVIIKGTQIYSPEKGRWVELSPQDVLQMVCFFFIFIYKNQLTNF